MTLRAFPVIYAHEVQPMVEFYEELDFSISLRIPEQGEAGYVTMVRDEAELAIVDAEWPARQTSLDMGTEPRFEMFVYVDDLEGTVETLRSRGAPVLQEPTDQPWGERTAYVTDPEGNPVSLALA
jgi:lactoylglutathione lyase